MTGSPHSLRMAIINGLTQAASEGLTKPALIGKVIEKHVLDYLAQRFSVAFIRSKEPVLRDIWDRIKQ